MTTKQHVIYDVVAGVALVEVTYRVSKLIVKRQLKGKIEYRRSIICIKSIRYTISKQT